MTFYENEKVNFDFLWNFWQIREVLRVMLVKIRNSGKHDVVSKSLLFDPVNISA